MRVKNFLAIILLILHSLNGIPVYGMFGAEESEQSTQAWEQQLKRQQEQQKSKQRGGERLDFREMLNINITQEAAEQAAAQRKSEPVESHPLVKPFEKTLQQQIDELTDHINSQLTQLNKQPKNSQILNDTVDSFEQLFALLDPRIKQLSDSTFSKASWGTISADTQEACMSFAEFIKSATAKSDVGSTLGQDQRAKVKAFETWLTDQTQKTSQLTYDQQISLYQTLAAMETDPNKVNKYLKKIDALDSLQQQSSIRLQIGRNLSNLKNISLQAKPLAFDTLITEYQQLLNTYTANFFDTLSPRTWSTLSSSERALCSELSDLTKQINDLKVNDELSEGSKNILTTFATWLEAQKQEAAFNKLPTLQKLSFYNTLRNIGQDVTTLQGPLAADLINNNYQEFTPAEMTLLAQAETKTINEHLSHLKKEIQKATASTIGELKRLYRKYVLRDAVINAAFNSVEQAVNILNKSPVIINALEEFKQQQSDPNAILFANNIQLMLADAPDLLTSGVENFNKTMQTLFQPPAIAKTTSTETRSQASKLIEDLDKEKKIVATQPLTELQLAQLYDLASKHVLDSLYELYSDADQASKNAIAYQVLKADKLATAAKNNYALFADKEQDPAKKKAAENAIKAIDDNYNRVYLIFADQFSFKTTPEINMLSDAYNYYNLIDPKQFNDALNTLAGTGQLRDQLQKSLSQQTKAKVINVSFSILFFAVIAVPIVVLALDKDKVLKLPSRLIMLTK